MKQINYQLVDNGVQNNGPNVTITDQNQYYFYYPCTSTYNCTEYEVFLEPGVYLFEVYGASGGHFNDLITSYRVGDYCDDRYLNSIHRNTKCSTKSSCAGAGGYTSGTIILKESAHAFISIGGQGLYGYKKEINDNSECYDIQNMIEGGYNGGGFASNYFLSELNYGAGSGQ